MRVHFIAIGGSAMHNLAIALFEKGFSVTGSDDEIFEPARGRLMSRGLLPDKEGWFPEKITPELDAVILGMHAKADNPELLKAKELNLKIFSYPEYLYEQSKEKTRIVIGGSHGKTTITAMILHVFQKQGLDTDFMVGAQLEGFDVMVKLTEGAPLMVIEGDEYLTSPIDRRPKFHLYYPDIAVISGIAWDHINVFPTFGNYLDQFRIFIDKITPGGTLIYCADDEELARICQDKRTDINIFPYNLPEHKTIQGQTIILHDGQEYPLQIFGRHNLLNLEAARNVCNVTGISDSAFYSAIMSFKGAAKRLERVGSNEYGTVFKDFAHAPSKVAATLKAVRDQFPAHRVVACLELHTYSSLNRDFLPLYAGTLQGADSALVYYNPHALQLKRLPDLTPEDVGKSFDHQEIEVFNDSEKLWERLNQEKGPETIFLMMSSGNYDGFNLKALINCS